ncbi:MAG: spinster family MFS transporter [Sphingomonadaceae bacterium]
MDSPAPHSTQARPSAQPASSGIVLTMLLIVYIFNFLDRQILSILAAPIQQELGLGDGQMGLLGGLAFAILYSTLAVPLATLADRTSRSWVITVSLVCWSAFTALCGLAHNFWQMFLARLGVGVGEAGGVAPSYALITEYFPPEKRSWALAVYSLGIPLGSAFGVLAGGYIAQNIDWRLAFFVVGAGGLLIAPLFKLLVRDKPKSEAAGTTIASRPSLGDTARLLMAKRSFWFLAFGASASSMLGYGVLFWLPSLLLRSYQFELVEASWFFGGLLLIGGVSGILLGGWLGGRLGQADRAWHGFVPAIAFVIGVPTYAIGISVPDWRIAFLVLLVPTALANVWLGPVLSAVQHLVAAPQRAMASALFLLINNLLGPAGGIYALGALSDALDGVYGSEALRYSMLYALGLYFVAATLMALGGMALRKDWVEETAGA